MLPLAHTFVSSKVTERKDALLLFGSVLPDIATTSSGNLGREEIHNSPYKFYDFIKTRYPNLMDLALGVLLHSNASKGADFYTDNYETGFAYTNGKHLNYEVASLLNTEPDKVSLVLSHNFIEGALDLLLVKNNPEIVDIYRESQESVKPNSISKALSVYLEHDQAEIEKELDFFKHFLCADHLVSKKAMVEGIAIPLVKMRMKTDIDGKEAEKLFGKAVALIEDSYQEFLDNTVKEMKVTFASYQ